MTYISDHWKQIASLSAFLLLFYFSACGLLHLKAESEMKYRRCFTSQLYSLQ